MKSSLLNAWLCSISPYQICLHVLMAPVPVLVHSLPGPLLHVLFLVILVRVVLVFGPSWMENLPSSPLPCLVSVLVFPFALIMGVLTQAELGWLWDLHSGYWNYLCNFHLQIIILTLNCSVGLILNSCYIPSQRHPNYLSGWRDIITPTSC